MTMILILFLGVFLSAFFSGSETGFYRVTRVRLLMDAKAGSRIAKFLMWLVARPTLVVATVLIGNNVANYLVSLGLVLISESLLASWSTSIQVLLPVLATPLLFIYGELLPKYLYYNAPYSLSKRGAPLMMICTALFLPLAGIVLALERLWQKAFRLESERAKYGLERKQLQTVLTEGHAAGILAPTQSELAQNLFTFGTRPIRQFAQPLRALPVVPETAGTQEILRLARRHKQRIVGVHSKRSADIFACQAISESVLFPKKKPKLLPVLSVDPDDSSVEVLTRMQSNACPLALVHDSRGTVMGFVLRDRLTHLLTSE